MILKKDINKKIAGYSLVMLYIIGIIPSLLIHHHDENIVPFEQATICEKVIYYGEPENICQHKHHVSKVQQDCWLCDHHTVTPQILFDFAFHIEPLSVVSVQYSSYYQSVHSATVAHSSNRGPPIA